MKKIQDNELKFWSRLKKFGNRAPSVPFPSKIFFLSILTIYFLRKFRYRYETFLSDFLTPKSTILPILGKSFQQKGVLRKRRKLQRVVKFMTSIC